MIEIENIRIKYRHERKALYLYIIWMNEWMSGLNKKLIWYVRSIKEKLKVITVKQTQL